MALWGESPKEPYILRAARRRGCASEAQDMVSPRGKAPGRFCPPYAGGHSYTWEVSATDLTGFSNVSHFAGQNGTGYAARAGRRGRARCAGRAEPAHGRFWSGLERSACRGVYWGLRPLAPRASARQCRERSEATHGRRWAKPSDDGMTASDTRKPVKDSPRLRHAPKRFSLWSLRGFFLTRQKETPQKKGRRGLPLLCHQSDDHIPIDA